MLKARLLKVNPIKPIIMERVDFKLEKAIIKSALWFIVLSVWIKETNKKALSGGFVEFKQKGADAGTSASAAAALQSDAVFAMMKDKITPEIISRVKGVFKFEIKSDGKGSALNFVNQKFN